MTYQTTEPLRATSLNATNRPISFFWHSVQHGTMTIDPPYQRGSAWARRQRMGLIKSWLLGVPIPAVIVNDRASTDWCQANPDETGQLLYAVVDGKQRILTALAWLAGELAVPASWFEPDAIEMTVETDDGPYVRFTGLTRPWQRRTERWQLPCAEGRLATLTAEAAVYLLVNGEGTPQTVEDMDRARQVAAGGAEHLGMPLDLVHVPGPADPPSHPHDELCAWQPVKVPDEPAVRTAEDGQSWVVYDARTDVEVGSVWVGPTGWTAVRDWHAIRTDPAASRTAALAAVGWLETMPASALLDTDAPTELILPDGTAVRVRTANAQEGPDGSQIIAAHVERIGHVDLADPQPVAGVPTSHPEFAIALPDASLVVLTPPCTDCEQPPGFACAFNCPALPDLRILPN